LARAVELDPTHAEAYYELGEAYSAVEDCEKAQQAYQNAVAARPDLVKANLKLAELYESQGATHRVVDLLHRAIEVDPDSVRSHYYTDLFMELALGSGDSYHRIVTAYQRAAASQPDRASIHYNLGRVLSRRYEASSQEQALVEYQQAISLRSRYPQALVAIGNAFLELGQPREALLRFQKASTMEWPEGKPRSEYTGAVNRTDAYLGLAKTYVGLGQYDQVIAALQLAIDASPDDGSSIFEAVAEACDGHGAALLKQEELGAAKQAFEMLVSLYGGIPRDAALEWYSREWASAYFSLAVTDYRLALQSLDRRDRDTAASLLDEALQAWKSGCALPADRTEQGHQLWKELHRRIESARKRAKRRWGLW
jgi:tetratricopeptide (TPR) repeat protein